MLHDDAILCIKSRIYPSDKVIVAPLNWGLGHASRCIPLIAFLIDYAAEVILVSDGPSYYLLKKSFPSLRIFSINSPEIKYSYRKMWINGLTQSFKIYEHIKLDRKVAETIVSETRADVIISDNRFGFRSMAARNIYLTHQLNLKTGLPFIDSLASWWHKRIIKKFDACWIVDHLDDELCLAGDLSRNKSIRNAEYIGPITRINRFDIDKSIDILILLSGPEPARTRFEHDIIKVLAERSDNVCLIRGTNQPITIELPPSWKVYDLADSDTVSSSINSAKTIISRSGYSTIMDIHHIDAKKILVPTPGQGEQEYLAKFHHKRNGFISIIQDKLSDLKDLLN
jgi:hypothetical protein